MSDDFSFTSFANYTNMPLLTHDIWIDITTYLSGLDLKILRLVGREMFFICNKRGLDSKTMLLASSKSLLECKTKFRTISLMTCSLERLNELVEKHQPEYVEIVRLTLDSKKRNRCGFSEVPKIKNNHPFKIEISVPEVGLSYIASSFPKLVDFVVHQYSHNLLVTGETGFECDKSLKFLRVGYSGAFPKVITQFNLVKTLQLDITGSINFDNMNSYLKSQKNLEKFSISMKYLARDKTTPLSIIIPKDSNIIEVYIQTCQEDTKFDTVLTIEKDLRVLKIFGIDRRFKTILHGDVVLLEMEYTRPICGYGDRRNIHICKIKREVIHKVIPFTGVGIGMLVDAFKLSMLPECAPVYHKTVFELDIKNAERLMMCFFARVQLGTPVYHVDIGAYDGGLEEMVEAVNKHTFNIYSGNKTRMYKIDPSIKYDLQLVIIHFQKFIEEF